MNKQKILAGIMFLRNPCNLIRKTKEFLTISSFYYRDLYDMMLNTYDVESLTDNDQDALMSRIAYVQGHESQTRIGWD